MISFAAVDLFFLRTEHYISHPLVGLYFEFRSCTHLSEFISTDWLSFQSLWSLCRCVLCRRYVPVFLYWVYATYIQSPFTVMLLLEGSWNLSRPFLSYLDFACLPFSVQLQVCAPYDRVLPHYTALLSTSCWMMGDALMPSFQRISSHRLQIIYSGIGV